MDFEFSEQQKIFKQTVEGISRREIEPLVAKLPPDDFVPREDLLKVLKRFQPLGVLGAGIPIEAGGSGLDKVSLGIVAEVVPPSVSIPLEGMQAHITRIHYGACDVIKKKIVAPALAGDIILANATVEPQGGSDTRSIETRAVPDGDHYVINGAKMWINEAAVADALIVTATLGWDAKGKPVLTRFVVEKDVSPYVVSHIKVTGSHYCLCEVTFDNCRVPKENLIGEKGDALRVLTGTWLGLRATFGLVGVHLAQKAFDASVAFAKQRRQFGKTIASFQMVQAMIVEMSILIETSRLLGYKALTLLDKGVWAAKECSMAKYWGTESGVRVTELAIKVHGAHGLSQALPLQQLWRDAITMIPPDGTSEIQQLIIGREILGVRAYGQ